MKNGLCVDEFGDKRWFKDYKLHREDGPAVQWLEGDSWWYKDGKLHRTDGPAIELADGYKAWWIDGKEQKIKN